MLLRSLVCLLPLLLGACAPVVIGGAAVAGTMALQERGFKAGVSDTKIKASIKDSLAGLNPNYLGQVGVDVLQGNVLLTGVVESQAAAEQIVSTVKQNAEIGAVYNELVTGSYGAGEISNDTWISTQLRARMVANADVYTINYYISVVKSHVYIYGIAQNAAEKERAIHIARTTKGVTMVHDYIRIATGG